VTGSALTAGPGDASVVRSPTAQQLRSIVLELVDAADQAQPSPGASLTFASVDRPPPISFSSYRVGASTPVSSSPRPLHVHHVRRQQPRDLTTSTSHNGENQDVTVGGARDPLLRSSTARHSGDVPHSGPSLRLSTELVLRHTRASRGSKVAAHRLKCAVRSFPSVHNIRLAWWSTGPRCA
jgi:hypothetical protein